MEAIETYYNGYRFRSRLEARWAVFFNILGVKYEYEPEGMVLDGTPYLPDFRLPEISVWLEVKGELSAVGEAFEKMRRLTAASPYGFVGAIFWMNFTSSHFAREDNLIFIHTGRGRIVPDLAWVWHICPVCSRVTLLPRKLMWCNLNDKERLRELQDLQRCSCSMDAAHPVYMTSEHHVLDAAYAAARSARFEFGGG